MASDALPDPRFLGHSIKKLICNSLECYLSLERRKMFGLSNKGCHLWRSLCAHRFTRSITGLSNSETELVLGKSLLSSGGRITDAGVAESKGRAYWEEREG